MQGGFHGRSRDFIRNRGLFLIIFLNPWKRKHLNQLLKTCSWSTQRHVENINCFRNNLRSPPSWDLIDCDVIYHGGLGLGLCFMALFWNFIYGFNTKWYWPSTLHRTGWICSFQPKKLNCAFVGYKLLNGEDMLGSQRNCDDEINSNSSKGKLQKFHQDHTNIITLPSFDLWFCIPDQKWSIIQFW